MAYKMRKNLEYVVLFKWKKHLITDVITNTVYHFNQT